MIKLTLIFFPTSHAKDFPFGPKENIYIRQQRARRRQKFSNRPRPNPPPPPDQSPENTQDNHGNDPSSHPKLKKKTHGTPEPSGLNTGQGQPAKHAFDNKRRPKSLGSALISGLQFGLQFDILI